MRVGIVGHGQDKFTPETELAAKNLIRKLLKKGDVVGKAVKWHLI